MLTIRSRRIAAATALSALLTTMPASAADPATGCPPPVAGAAAAAAAAAAPTATKDARTIDPQRKPAKRAEGRGARSVPTPPVEDYERDLWRHQSFG